MVSSGTVLSKVRVLYNVSQSILFYHVKTDEKLELFKDLNFT
jgi:hypothetical protein